MPQFPVSSAYTYVAMTKNVKNALTIPILP